MFKTGNPWQCVALDLICDGVIDCDKGNVEVGLGDDEIGCAENCPKERPVFVYSSTQVNSTCCVKGRLDCCLELFHDYVEIDLVILNAKDSCDGSRLNTSESSNGSCPFFRYC